jgi:L-amino acid N-acyltransferase YncA
MIRAATEADAQALVDIYNYYITDTVITFEDIPLNADEFAGRIHKVLEGGYPYLVAEEDGVIVGYAYSSQFRTRVAYRFSTETTVYLKHDLTGKGHGTALYTALLKELRARGFHLAIGGVTLPNPASQRLHEKMGFTKIGHFHEVGFKFDQWLDVGFWELKL